jgi:hypothetical protein
VDISSCCSLCTNRSKTHLRESMISKKFSGGYTPGPPFSRGRGRKGGGWKGEMVRDMKRTGEGKGDGKTVREGRGRKGEKKKKGRGEDVWPH